MHVYMHASYMMHVRMHVSCMMHAICMCLQNMCQYGFFPRLDGTPLPSPLGNYNIVATPTV